MEEKFSMLIRKLKNNLFVGGRMSISFILILIIDYKDRILQYIYIKI